MNLKTGDVTLPTGNHSYVYLQTGLGGKDHEGVTVQLVPVINEKLTYIGKNDEAKWGIDCDGKSSCEVTDPQNHEDFYYFQLYQYKSGQL